MPYTFWFAVSLLGYVRALTRNAVRDYVLFAAGAAAAVCTKDQAYGLYLLPILYLIAHRVRSVAAGASGSPVVALLRDPALPAAAAAGVLGFAVLQALPFNWSGLQQHFAYITDAGGAYRMIDSASPSGQAFLFRRTFDHLVWSMSWPGLLIGLAGIVLLLVRGQAATALALLLPALSYYVTFIAVVGYSYDRFMMPVCLVLSMFAGAALDAMWPPGAPRWRTATVAAVLVYMALRTTSINVMMAADGRYFVERWIRGHVPPEARIGVVEHQVVLPRLAEFTRVTLNSPIGDLPAVRPEMPRAHRQLPDPLAAGRAGARLVRTGARGRGRLRRGPAASNGDAVRDSGARAEIPASRRIVHDAAQGQSAGDGVATQGPAVA